VIFWGEMVNSDTLSDDFHGFPPFNLPVLSAWHSTSHTASPCLSSGGGSLHTV
jgi:hypothetical protein